MKDAITATNAGRKNTHFQFKVSIRSPARNGPNAAPAPKVVPIKLNTRVRAWPLNSWVNAAIAPAKAAAAPTP
ncbi:hypothetical protein D3C72_2287660 [compost metagenome]